MLTVWTQAQPYLDLKCLKLKGIPERIFRNFAKKNQHTTKTQETFPRGKDLMFTLVRIKQTIMMESPLEMVGPEFDS